MMMTSRRFVWLASSIAALWLALGCSSLPYSNNSRPVEPPPAPVAELPATPASR